MFRELFETILELQEKDKEILELSLQVQRRQIQINLLEAVTFDNVTAHWGNDPLDAYTVGLTIHFVRKAIRRLTGG